MKLRGIDFGCVTDASGVRGFFGEGHWFHRWVPRLDFSGSTFVAKTATLRPREGNLGTKRFPDCVVTRFGQGAVLNAVGLSNPGAEALFADGRWQERKEPFFISFMPLETDPLKRADEISAFARLMRKHLPVSRHPVGLQVNLSCPNAGHAADGGFVREAAMTLAHLACVGVPLMVKIDLTLPLEAALRVAALPGCDALCMTNAIRWGLLPDKIRWKEIFGTTVSPLERYGGGGLSGSPLLPLVAAWVHIAKAHGLRKPVNAGGGILGPEDAEMLRSWGADSVFLGSIAMLRGWRVRQTIRETRALYGYPF